MKNVERNSAHAAGAVQPAPAQRATDPEPTPRWVVVFGVVAAALFLGFVAVHLAGRGLGHHRVGAPAPVRNELSRGQTP